MSAGASQNLPGPLQQAEAACRDAAVPLPVLGALVARRARHFAASVRLGRDEPQAMRRLDELTGGLDDVPSLGALLPKILDGALVLTGADFGNIQLLDPITGALRMVTQSGFDYRFLEHFAVVVSDKSACGRAARQGAQAVIADVRTDPAFAPHRDVAAASGFRAVQSTPLADTEGRLVGMVSTHFRRPHRPPDLDVRIMDLYADSAGDAIAAYLAAPGAYGHGDPIGPAVPQAASAADTMSDFAGYVVTRLFSVGIRLESARSIIGKGPAGDRVAAATDEVDLLIRDIRTTLFGLAADPAALLKERAAHTARSLRASALDAIALLEQQADLARRPGRIDYPTEIKRWRAFADQAEQMARRWEQRP